MDPNINLPEVLRLHELHLAGDPDGRRAVLIDTDLHNTDLAGADLRTARLRRADLRNARLRGADLRGADLGEADLRGADLGEADLRGARLYDADLSDARLRKARLRDADLQGARLYDADLREADLRRADLGRACLRGADLFDADLDGALGLPIAEDAPQRLKAVAAQVLANPSGLDMQSWHGGCGTTHCLAGWAIHQAGPLGEVLQELQGPAFAGRLLLGHQAADRFYKSNEEVLEWLRTL